MPSIRGEQVVSDRLKFFESKKQLQITEPTGSESRHHYSLIAAAINHELILVGSHQDYGIKALNPAKLMNQPDDSNQILFNLQVGFKPQLLSVSQHGMGSVLLVAGSNEHNNCPSVHFFNLDTRESIATIDAPNQLNSDIVDAQWNPIYHDSIVALCTSSGWLLVVALCKDSKRAALVYQDCKYGALSCSWSPKGKNLAVAKSDGQIMRLEPVISESSFTFKDVANSSVNPSNEAISDQHRIVKLSWVRQKTLLCVHAKLNSANGPETVYSLVSIKPTEPLVYWSGVCSERCDAKSTYYPVNLNNIIVCASSSSSEILVLSPRLDETSADKTPDWGSVFINAEPWPIDLHTHSTINGTYLLGYTFTFVTWDIAKPILILYSSAGILSAFVCDSTNPLSLPPLLEPQACPIDIPRPVISEPAHTNVAQSKPNQNGKPYTIKEEEDGDDGLDLPITPLKSCPRESISQWSVERVKRNMSVKSLVSSMEKQRR